MEDTEPAVKGHVNYQVTKTKHRQLKSKLSFKVHYKKYVLSKLLLG